MSYTIVYQSFSVHFNNGLCFVVTQDGANNCTEFNFRTRREVLEKDWHLARYSANERGVYLQQPDALLKSIKQVFIGISNNNLEDNSGIAYKSRGAFKPYSFWVKHYSNAVTRYSISAEEFINKFKTLSVYVWGVKPEVRHDISTVEELYNLFVQYPDKQFSFGSISRNFAVSSVIITKEQVRPKTCYYAYNLLSNGIYCKQHRRKALIACCFNSNDKYNCKRLDYETEQYLLNNFHVKSVLLFKSIPECVAFFLGKDHMNVEDIFIGILGQDNVPTKETKLTTYLEKTINY